MAGHPERPACVTDSDEPVPAGCLYGGIAAAQAEGRPIEADAAIETRRIPVSLAGCDIVELGCAACDLALWAADRPGEAPGTITPGTTQAVQEIAARM